ncbi:hypothetical protein EC973_005713 [Apophysomyces ossiformis]|uniref:Transcription initiation factor IIB n=1 Tax=Apophysomyces ossiformis TaxID=679940 RepID=A0A8H7BRF0_9FUNG|nr:hypothetical protein EC973_005713 [Apophysomyces ossiformis]
MTLRCQSCGATDTYYNEGETYCTNCGLVLNDYELTEYNPDATFLSQASKPQKKYDACADYIERYGRHLGLSDVEVEAAKQRLQLYRKVQSSIRTPRETAVSLLFIACQVWNRGENIFDFVDKKFDLDPMQVVRTHKHVRTALGLPQQESSLMRQVDIILPSIQEILTRAFPTMDELLVRKTTKQILKLAEEYGLLIGRPMKTIVAACLVVSAASQHAKPSIHKGYERKLPYPKDLNWDALALEVSCMKRTLRERYMEILNMLCKYARNLPKFICDNLTESNVQFYLQDIFSWRSTVEERGVEEITYEAAEEKVPPAFDRAQKKRSIRAKQIADAEACIANNELDPAHLDIETYRIYFLLSKHSKSKIEDMTESELAAELQLLLKDTPLKKRDLNRTEIDEEDMSDKELEMYLGSPDKKPAPSLHSCEKSIKQNGDTCVNDCALNEQKRKDTSFELMDTDRIKRIRATQNAWIRSVNEVL